MSLILAARSKESTIKALKNKTKDSTALLSFLLCSLLFQPILFRGRWLCILLHTHRPPFGHASRPGHLPPTSLFAMIFYLIIFAPADILAPTMHPDVLQFLSMGYNMITPFVCICFHIDEAAVQKNGNYLVN